MTHELPAEFLYENEELAVIQDAHPLTPLHLLVIPRKHIASLNQIALEDEALLARLILKARDLAFEKGVGESGYRVAINTGAGGGQTVFHLHIHLLAGASNEPGLIARGLK